MEKTFKPVARKENLVIQEASDEVLVYDLKTNKAHCLNSTAAFVWRACDGANSIDEISQQLTEKAGSQVPAELVWLAIDQLQEKELLSMGASLSEKGSSRRDVLKKMGLAAVVALPVVASLVAPKSAMASTSCTCTNPGTAGSLDCAAQSGCGPDCLSSGVCGTLPA